MKRFFALAALVLGMVSCQTEPEGLDVIVGGEQEAVINVSLAEATRTSADSGIVNVDNNVYDLRYILEVYDTAGNTFVYRDVQTVATNVKTVSFPVRLIPEREYNFVVWADFVTNDSKNDLYYTTTNGLDEVSIITSKWVQMDEARDAYTGHEVVNGYNSGKSINITLTRPFGKMRVITTDIDALNELNGKPMPDSITVTYTNKVYTAFNALTQKPMTESDKFYTYDLENVYGEDWNTENRTLFTDYIFGTASGSIQFAMDVVMTNGNVVSNNFNTEIPVKRNFLTTITGDILTDGNNIKVDVSDGFENGQNPSNPPYYQVTVKNGVELVKALYEGREIIVLNNITVTAADVEAYLATTRTGNAINPVLNLNGFTITIENNGTDALVDLNGGALTVEGEGAIESTAGALVEGTTVVTGEATVAAAAAVDENGNSAVKTGRDALVYICANGGEFTFTGDLDATEVILIETTKPVVINGANFTLTTNATRAIRVTPSKANVTINDLNIVVATERVYPNDVRGISLDAGLNGVDLTLNNCSVDFTHKTANDWAYAVNVSGNGTDNKVTVNGGTYNGANVVNAHSAKNTIVVKNATLTSLYPNNDTYYGACIWVLQNQGSTVYAEGNTFNGNNAVAFNLGTGTTLEEKDNIDNTMYYDDGTCYVGSSEKFQKAIAEGANNIVLGKGTFDLPSSLTQNEGTLTIKGRGNDVTVLNGAKNSNANHPGNYANGVALEFEGLTFKTANNGYNGGFGHAVSVTFRESKIVGQFYAHSSAPHYFYNCTIDPLTGYLYTYGSDCVFEGCTFAASEGKALQVYEDSATGENTVTITNCAFVAAKQATTWDGKPVTGIDINSNGAKFEVYINNCTTTGFPTGLNSNSDLWNIKDAGKAHANVYVDGVQVWFAGFETVAEGLLKKDSAYVVMNAEGLAALNAMMVNQTAGKAVKVTLGADIDFAGKTWTPVNSHVDTPFYFSELDGNGKTISNLTINGQAMFTRFAGSGNVTIKNVTFDNAKVNSNGNINTSILTVQTYQNVLLDNVDVKNSTIIGGYKVAPLIATVYNEGTSTITATLKNCDVENTVVKATSYDFCTAGMVAFVYEGDNDRIVFENCSVKDVQLYAPNSYTAHAAIYTAGSETLYNEAEGVVVENVTFENI